MTRRARVVIGAGWGDEGKGLVVDALAAETRAEVVVRFNGGAQAGHTVTLPDGRRHVFHHFGAGALAGARTHLSRFFVCNPMVFQQEAELLETFTPHVSLGVSVDPRSLITTPFDILINQILEESRGVLRHGSCGLGFGETIERSQHDDLCLSYRSLRSEGAHAHGRDAWGDLRQTLEAIRDRWVPERLAALGVEDTRLSAWHRNLLGKSSLIDRFIDDCRVFKARTSACEHLPEATILFEGAQGLQLDQDYGAFPHVTRSNTGLKNVVDIAREEGIEGLDVTYVTRAYATRHGSGPMSRDYGVDFNFNVVDETNTRNEWQGTLRVGTLNATTLKDAIHADLRYAADLPVTWELAVTCLDQARGRAPFLIDGNLVRNPVSTVAAAIGIFTHAHRVRSSWGPTRGTFTSALTMPERWIA